MCIRSGVSWAFQRCFKLRGSFILRGRNLDLNFGKLSTCLKKLSRCLEKLSPCLEKLSQCLTRNDMVNVEILACMMHRWKAQEISSNLVHPMTRSDHVGGRTTPICFPSQRCRRAPGLDRSGRERCRWIALEQGRPGRGGVWGSDAIFVPNRPRTCRCVAPAEKNAPASGTDASFGNRHQHTAVRTNTHARRSGLCATRGECTDARGYASPLQASLLPRPL